MNIPSRVTVKFKSEPVIFWALPLLFIIFRLTVLLSSGTHTSEGEELFRGTLARELISGLKLPIWEYQADHYSGGSLLIGLAAVPFFLIFGPSLFSLKLAPLLFAFSTLVLMMLFLRRYFGTWTAIFAGLFFTLAPPSFVQLSMVAMGFHSESILFSMLILISFYQYFFGGRSERSLFLFGLASGLGFWFTHITIVTFLACLGSWLLLEPRVFFNRRTLGILCGGGGIGLIPWVIYNIANRFEGVGFLLNTLLHFRGNKEGSPSAFSFSFPRLAQLISEALPMSFGFAQALSIPGRVISSLYFGSGILLILPLFKKWRGELLPLLLFPLAFLGVYWLSSVEMTAVAASDSFYLFFDDCRYFVPFQFSFFILLGITCAQGPLRRFAGILLLGFGIFAFSSLMFREGWAQVTRLKGYSYTQLGGHQGHIWPRSYKNYGAFFENIQQYPEPDRFFLFWGSLYGLQFENDIKNPEKLKRLLQLVPTKHYPQLAEGFGYAIGAQEGLAFNPSDPILDLFPQKDRGFFYMGLITATLYSQLQTVGAYLDYAVPLPRQDREWFYFMLGEFCPFDLGLKGLDLVLQRNHGETDREITTFFHGVGVRAMLNWMVDGFTFPQAVVNLGFPIPEAHKKDFYWGVGWGVRQNAAEDRPRALAWLEQLSPEVKREAWKGFEACEKAYSIPP